MARSNLIPKKQFLIFLALFMCSQSYGNKLQQTNLTLFFQDRSGGPNATVLPVTGLPGHLWTFQSFGTVFVTDDPITEGLDMGSAEIARGQGIYVTSALDGSTTHVMISITFTNKEYNGSTLEIQGGSRQFEKVREVSVVGGTREFRYAKGYATLETVYYDMSIAHAVIQCNISIQH